MKHGHLEGPNGSQRAKYRDVRLGKRVKNGPKICSNVPHFPSQRVHSGHMCNAMTNSNIRAQPKIPRQRSKNPWARIHLLGQILQPVEAEPKRPLIRGLPRGDPISSPRTFIPVPRANPDRQACPSYCRPTLSLPLTVTRCGQCDTTHVIHPSQTDWVIKPKGLPQGPSQDQPICIAMNLLGRLVR